MKDNELCASVGRTLPPLFVCSPAPQEGIRVRTPMLYPDGGIVDVFVLTRGGSYTVTDFGDALGWLGLQSVSWQRSPKQQMLIQDVCQTLRIEQLQGQLALRSVTDEALGESVLRVAQAVVRVSDLWFTFRTQSFQNTADEVGEWLFAKGRYPSSAKYSEGAGRHKTGLRFRDLCEWPDFSGVPPEHWVARRCTQAG